MAKLGPKKDTTGKSLGTADIHTHLMAFDISQAINNYG